MKRFFLQLLLALVALALTCPSAFALIEDGQVQVGRYEMLYSSEVPTVDVLEILPGQRFRFSDHGTLKAEFFFEGHYTKPQKQADGSYTMELNVEKDGRLLRGKVVSRTTSEFNLRLKKMNLKVYEHFASAEVIMERHHSYRGGDFWEQTRMADTDMKGSIQNFDFLGMPIDY